MMKNRKAIAATFLAIMVVSVQALPVHATSFAPPESRRRRILASSLISPKQSSAKSSGTLYLE